MSSKKLRLIQVGLGDFGQRWMKLVRQNPAWEYAAIATRNEKVRSACGSECGLDGDRRFATLEDLLASELSADAVLVTTPHFRHREDVTAALAGGHHVLVEKPLAGTWDDALTIRHAVETSGRTLMVGENYRFADGARIMRELVDSGAIGDPEYLSLQYFVGHEFPKGDWRNDYQYPVLVENATHQFDLIRYVCRTEPLAVFCSAFGSRRTPHWPKPNVSVHIEMTGGMHAQFDASWSYREFTTPWEGLWRLHGTHGSIRWTENRIELVAGSDRREIKVPSKPSDHTLAAALQEFTRALVEKDRPSVDITDNMATLSIVFGAIRSASEGRTIRIEEMYQD